MISLPVAFIAFVFGFGFLVFIHELGHFLVAKWVGIRCTQFAIGFGPAICSWRKGVGLRRGSTEPAYFARAGRKLEERGENASDADQEKMLAAADRLRLGETEYRLNWLPLGGYVKMLGQEDLDPASQSHDPRAYTSKSVGARFAVISAGVIMNMATGIVLFIAAFMAGVEFPPAVVGGVNRSMPAAHADAVGHEGDPAYRGLRRGDRIVAIDGKRVTDMVDVRINTALGKENTPLRLTVRRPDVNQPLTYRITPRFSPTTKLLSIGVAPPRTNKVASMREITRAYRAGVRPDMAVVKAGGKSVKNFGDLQEALAAAQGRAVSVVFEKKKAGQVGKTVRTTLAAKPPLSFTDDGVAHLAGFVPATRVALVSEGSAADQAGMKVGDVIASLQGESWPDPRQVFDILGNTGGRPVKLTVLRKIAKPNHNGKGIAAGDKQKNTAARGGAEAEGEPDVSGGRILALDPIKLRGGKLGIVPVPDLAQPIVSRVLPATPAATFVAKGGGQFVPGSRIVSVSGHKIKGWADFYRVLTNEVAAAPSAGDAQGTSGRNGQSVASASKSASLDHAEEKSNKPAAPANDSGQTTAQNQPQIGASKPLAVPVGVRLSLGDQPVESGTFQITRTDLAELQARDWLAPDGINFELRREPVKAGNPWQATVLGLKKTKQFITQAYLMILRLFQGSVGVPQLRGPVGIVDEGTKVAQSGWSYLFYFLGLLSVNLAVINFLPIPVVDGGHAVFLLAEKIKGSPVSPRIQMAALYLGLLLIGGVFLLVTYHDVVRKFHEWFS